MSTGVFPFLSFYAFLHVVAGPDYSFHHHYQPCLGHMSKSVLISVCRDRTH